MSASWTCGHAVIGVSGVWFYIKTIRGQIEERFRILDGENIALFLFKIVYLYTQLNYETKL